MSEHVDVVVAGHVCLDVFPKLFGPSDFPSGALVEVGPARFSAGGVVANVGQALLRLGARARLLGQVGDDAFGRLVRDVMGEAGRDLIAIPCASTSYTVVLDRPGADRTFLHCPGVNDDFDPDAIPDDALRGARIVHFGYPPLMRSMYEDGGIRLARFLARARSLGILTSLDMSLPDPDSPSGRVDWRAWLANVLPFVDFFCPSDAELRFMLGDESPTRACLYMGAGAVLLKKGSDGAELFVSPTNVLGWEPDESLEACFSVNVVGTTGAGDATIAGFLFGVVEGFSANRCLRAGLAVGAASCEAEDATSAIRPWDEIAERFGLT